MFIWYDINKKTTNNNSRGGKNPHTRLIDELNKLLSKSFLRFDFDFYEDDEDFNYLEDLNKESPTRVINCIACKEPLFLTPPSKEINNEIIDKIIEFLKKKNVSEKEIEKIKKLKGLPICRWDLFKLISEITENKELKGLFQKVVSFYDFDNPRDIYKR